MSFSSPDIGEQKLGKTVNDFQVNDFMPYAMEMFKHHFGFKFMPEPTRDRAIYQWLLKTYGEDAGRIVKWVFYRYKGTVDGDNFNVTMFASGHRWWIDKMFTEMKVATMPKVQKPKAESRFLSASDMLNYAKSA